MERRKEGARCREEEWVVRRKGWGNRRSRRGVGNVEETEGKREREEQD